jgi:CheY-like chemotaxis protein
LLTAPILVVEDSDEDFDTLCDAAAAAGVTRRIRRVASGGDCLALLSGEGESRADGQVNDQVRGQINSQTKGEVKNHEALPVLPALILMDLNSHGVDGREALVAIKTKSDLKQIPVVVLTTSANPKDVAFCYQAGANAYHVKPVRHDQYLLLLGKMLHYWLGEVTLHVGTPAVD